VSSRTARATQRNPVLKKKERKENITKALLKTQYCDKCGYSLEPVKRASFFRFQFRRLTITLLWHGQPSQ
jgi:putative hemolysin